MIPAVPHVAAMAAYALADLSVSKGKRLVSLSQNESLRGPSPTVIEAARAAVTASQLYPDPDWTNLRAAIAGAYGVAAHQIQDRSIAGDACSAQGAMMGTSVWSARSSWTTNASGAVGGEIPPV